MENPFNYIAQNREKIKEERLEKEKLKLEETINILKEFERLIEPYRNFPRVVLTNLLDAAYPRGRIVEPLPFRQSLSDEPKRFTDRTDKLTELLEWEIYIPRANDDDNDVTCVEVLLEFDKDVPMRFICKHFINAKEYIEYASLSEESLIKALVKLHPI